MEQCDTNLDVTKMEDSYIGTKVRTRVYIYIYTFTFFKFNLLFFITHIHTYTAQINRRKYSMSCVQIKFN